MQSLDRQRIKRLLLFQLFMLMAATLGGLVFGRVVALSAFLGGFVALAANALFALWVFAPYRAQQPGSLLARFYAAEVLKLLLVGLAFAALFIWVRPLNVAALFVAFFVVQVLSPLLAHGLAGETRR